MTQETLIGIIHSIRKLYWYIFRPTTFGVRAIVLFENKILLVKHKYEKFWYLPGGAIKKNENIADALVRELKEELNFSEKINAKFFAKYFNDKEYKKDTIYVYIVVIKNLPDFKNKNFEIKEIKFFDFDNLPEDISLGTKNRILEYLKLKIVSADW